MMTEINGVRVEEQVRETITHERTRTLIVEEDAIVQMLTEKFKADDETIEIEFDIRSGCVLNAAVITCKKVTTEKR